MILPELYILRHGETEWNQAGRWQGHLDSPLTEKGRAQAADMGALLKAEGVGSSQGYRALVSPQARARVTAEIALEGLGLSIEVVEDLREILVGEWTGLSMTEMRTGWPELAVDHWLDAYRNAPGGEGLESVWERAGRVLESLDGPAVIVTHGITSRALRTRAMGYSLERLEELPGGQGVVHHISGGVHRTL